MVETIFSCVVAVICMFPLFILGIVQYHSKKPVGFWAGKEPPKAEQLTDVKSYNHRHGIMWMVYSAAFVLCFFIGLVISGPHGYSAAIAGGIECLSGLLVLIWYHNRLNRKYLK